ncbi:MAG TPA: primosomal protein N', partial [bacterium]|nr:primosomal protein N' [bacterium]
MVAFAEIAVGVPVEGTFTYRVPEALVADVTVGRRVRVPFGARKMTGFVVQTAPSPAKSFSGETKDVLEALDDGPMLEPDELALARWIAEYYRHPLGLVLKTVLPAGLEGGRVKAKTERVFTLPTMLAFGDASATKRRAPAQEKVLEAIRTEGPLSSSAVRERFGARGAAAAAELVKKGLLALEHEEVLRAPSAAGAALVAHEPATAPALYPAQEAALAALSEAIRARAFAPFLLQGVTGSGKTEVYLRAIALALELGRTALVLVPEIALTPQLTGRFRARFGDRIAVLHSGLSDGQRYDEWRRIKRGDATIAVGARSAVFAPLKNLGIVVVDEEHDGSYKQDEGLRYHARDVAVVRAQRAGAAVVMGSATPSLETFQNAVAGRYRRLVLPERVGARPLPPVDRVQLTNLRARGPLSPRLLSAIEETLAAGKQTILFLNRRGFAPSLVCDDCAHVITCPDCAVAMIFHSPGLAKKGPKNRE